MRMMILNQQSNFTEQDLHSFSEPTGYRLQKHIKSVVNMNRSLGTAGHLVRKRDCPAQNSTYGHISARRKKLQRSSFDKDIVLKRLMVPTDDETAVTQKVRQHVTKLNSDRSQTTRVEMSDIVNEPSMPPPTSPGLTGSAPNAYCHHVPSKATTRKPKRYGCIQYPWWSDDNIQTYVE
ncbi:hypothetical protein FWK35_00016147 [Aphis craccivora]|uniref:Uncharacterized protein n=1 Tax=Aphis craccivora TaxID=307492 RepID=A0A6G0YB29_APHCR|nr:hypothetical protein FWK35_00016147 [Aphis craccivora]